MSDRRTAAIDPTLMRWDRVHWKVAILTNSREPVAHKIRAWTYAVGSGRHIETVRTACSGVSYRRVRWVLPTKWAAKFARPCRNCWKEPNDDD